MKQLSAVDIKINNFLLEEITDDISKALKHEEFIDVFEKFSDKTTFKLLELLDDMSSYKQLNLNVEDHTIQQLRKITESLVDYRKDDNTLFNAIATIFKNVTKIEGKLCGYISSATKRTLMKLHDIPIGATSREIFDFLFNLFSILFKYKFKHSELNNTIKSKQLRAKFYKTVAFKIMDEYYTSLTQHNLKDQIETDISFGWRKPN